MLVNLNDPESIEIAKYYQKARLIPDSNIIYLNFKKNSSNMSAEEFKKVEDQLVQKVGANIQAYALAWRKPWKVDCMSITSAFSLGFSKEYCAKDCSVTKSLEYFNSQSRLPYLDYKIRPSMMLSAISVTGVKKNIDIGVSADYIRSMGSAYLLSTSDRQRNVRAINYPIIEKTFGQVLKVKHLKADAIKNKKDIMFYFTGLAKVKWVKENNYLPGAIADHLTSVGGQLFKGEQMSVLKWIEAGVTGTYGTVVEPCNITLKFPNVGVVIQKYLSGETLIESYWKSVQMPGQGLFVGEPLSSPYKGCNLKITRKGKAFYSKEKITNLVLRVSRNC